MNEYENILMEKCAEYIWLHNQCIRKIHIKKQLFVFQIIFLSFTSGLIMILNDNINHYLRTSIGVSSLYSGLLFMFYCNYKSQYEKHSVARARFIYLLNDMFQVSLLSYEEIVNFLLLKQSEFANIVRQSPHVPYPIMKKFKQTFSHLISYKPYLQTELLLNENPKEYRKTYRDIMFLTKYFNIWKKQYNYNRKYRQSLITQLGPFYNENKYLYSLRPLTRHRNMLQFQNIKLRNNNLEIEII